MHSKPQAFRDRVEGGFAVVAHNLEGSLRFLSVRNDRVESEDSIKAFSMFAIGHLLNTPGVRNAPISDVFLDSLIADHLNKLPLGWKHAEISETLHPRDVVSFWNANDP
jgi:hypothetical protein